MFNYEENEKRVNKAIMKCLNERFEFGGFDEPETFSGNTAGDMSIKQGYEIPKKIDIKLEVTSDGEPWVKKGNVSLKDPKTGKPLSFNDIEFERIGDFGFGSPEDNIGYWWYSEHPELKGGWAMNCKDNVDNYDLFNDIIKPLVNHDDVESIKLITKLVKRGSISLSNPFFKK
jgi:hypothetical protein